MESIHKLKENYHDFRIHGYDKQQILPRHKKSHRSSKDY